MRRRRRGAARWLLSRDASVVPFAVQQLADGDLVAVEGDAVAGGERLQEVQVGRTLALLDDEIAEQREEAAVDLSLEQLPIVREDLSECFFSADVEREVLDERGEPLGEV